MSEEQLKRRAAVFRNNFLPYSETFIHDELRFHHRYETVVMARRKMNADRFEGHNVVAVETIPEPRNRAASLFYAATTRSRLIQSAVANGGFDIIHAHFGHNGIYALGFAERNRLPLVVSLHGGDVTTLISKEKYKPGWWNYLTRYKRMFRTADLFLAASQEMKTLIESVGCPPEKVVVFRLGIDLDTFVPAPEKRRTDPPLVVMTGRFVPKKGHELGIRAFAQALKQGVSAELVIIGDGLLKSRYLSLIGELSICDSVKLAGVLPPSAVKETIQSSSVVLAPSIVAPNLDRESGMIVAKEASACGVPVIGHIHGGIPDIIEDGKTGYLVREGDVDKMSAHLCSVLTNESLRVALGEAARRKMEREYNIRDRILALEEIYDSIVASHRR